MNRLRNLKCVRITMGVIDMTYEEARTHLLCGKINCLNDFSEDQKLRAKCIEALEKQISLVQILKDAEEAHPYKVVGDFDTYSQYNEGWADAIEYINSRLE